jgi:hypothetical protein
METASSAKHEPQGLCPQGLKSQRALLCMAGLDRRPTAARAKLFQADHTLGQVGFQSRPKLNQEPATVNMSNANTMLAASVCLACVRSAVVFAHEHNLRGASICSKAASLIA